MSQGNWGGGPGGGWGGGQPPGGGYGPPGGGAPPGGGGYGAPPGGGYGAPPGGGGYGAPPGGGGYGAPPGGGGYGAPPGGGFGAPQGGGFAPPPAGYPPGYSPQTGGGAVAWEDTSKGFFDRWWSTVKAVCFDSRTFYSAAAQNDNPWPSVTFAMSTAGLIGLPVGLVMAVFYVLFGAMIATAISSGGRGAAGGAGAVMGASIVAGIFVTILCPVMLAIQALISPWIAAGVDHLMLVLMKGATRSYSHSVRVFGYAWGANFWMIIPGVGVLAAAIFMIIARVVGLDETHKCGIGKAIAAVFLPAVLCCLCYCGFWMIFGMAGSAAGHR